MLVNSGNRKFQIGRQGNNGANKKNNFKLEVSFPYMTMRGVKMWATLFRLLTSKPMNIIVLFCVMRSLL